MNNTRGLRTRGGCEASWARSNDSRTAAMTFTKTYGVSYPVASDPAATTAGAFGVIALPQTFFLNAQHRIVDRVYGGVTASSLAKGVKLMGGG